VNAFVGRDRDDPPGAEFQTEGLDYDDWLIEQAAGPWAGCLLIKDRDLRQSIGDPFNKASVNKWVLVSGPIRRSLETYWRRAGVRHLEATQGASTMPKFSFHLRDADTEWRDDGSCDFPGIAEAEQHARNVADELMRNKSPSELPDRFISVTDGASVEVARIALSEGYIWSSEAARRSGYSVTHIVNLVRTGRLLGRKQGTRWLVDERALNAFLANREGRTKRGGRPRKGGAKSPGWLDGATA
jgi:hypothetical protein